VLRATVKELQSNFRLKPGDPVRWRAGRLVPHIHANMDDASFDTSYSYYTDQHLAETCRALSAFTNWAGFPEIGARLTDFALRASRSDFHVRSRATFAIDQTLKVVTYKNKIEFLFSPEMASALQNFFSEYGAP